MARKKTKTITKHSFQITEETLETFQNTCNAVGLKFWEGLEAALEDWINFQEDTVKQIQKARKTGAKKRRVG